MSKRLQVLLPELEYRRISRLAKRRGIPLAEWVRAVIREAYQRESIGSPDRKLAAVREGARHAFPSGDIGEMLRDIEAGYLGDSPR